MYVSDDLPIPLRLLEGKKFEVRQMPPENNATKIFKQYRLPLSKK